MPLPSQSPGMAPPYRRPSQTERGYLPSPLRHDYDYPDQRWEGQRHAPALPSPRMPLEEASHYASEWSPPVAGPYYAQRPGQYHDRGYARSDDKSYYASNYASHPVGPSDTAPLDHGRRLSSVHTYNNNERVAVTDRPTSSSGRSAFVGDARSYTRTDFSSPSAWPYPRSTTTSDHLSAAAHAGEAAYRRDSGYQPQHARTVRFDNSPPLPPAAQPAPHPSYSAQPPARDAAQPSQRKRLRISRACDECRRRKTRCDVVGAFPGEPDHPLTISGAVPLLEANDEPKGELLILQPCINCRRSDVTCCYSKRPLKRGPSKGYIKDLERRLNSLESQIVLGEKEVDELEDDQDQLSSHDMTTTLQPKIRAEDRISRLESVLERKEVSDPTDVKLEPTDPAGDLVVNAATPPPHRLDNKPAQSINGVKRSDSADVKVKVMQSCLHATFPILPSRPVASNVTQLEERVLARGMRLLLDTPPKSTEVLLHPEDSRSSTPVGKIKSHAAKVATLIGQASAGLGNTREDMAAQSRPNTERLRAMRKIAHRIAGQEADLLMLCHLDHLRNGQNNNSALAAAVSKLGSGPCIQYDEDTFRRRTLLFMLDRWHALAFGTPHLLTGRFGVENCTFQSMKTALGDVSESPLGDAVYEVLRAAVMFGHLNDLAQSTGGWKHVALTDVEAVIHSVMDENERPAQVQDLHDSTALRHSLEATVRCYHALHTLPLAENARLDDVSRVFALAEQIVVLGSVKTPISLQGKLLHSAIGPHVLAVAGIAFFWCLRVTCRLVALHHNNKSASPVKMEETESPCMVLEHFRRKILDYVRMCGPFCLFSGGSATDAGSFKSVYLRLALFFNQIVGLATQMGTLVTTLPETSPANDDIDTLATETNQFVEIARDLGSLGYVLSSTSPREAWLLVET